MPKAKVVRCHELSVLRDIFNPDIDETNIVQRLKQGETLTVDDTKVYWDSYDTQYYRCDIGMDFETYVAVGGVEIV